MTRRPVSAVYELRTEKMLKKNLKNISGTPGDEILEKMLYIDPKN